SEEERAERERQSQEYQNLIFRLEKLTQEHAALLALRNKVTKDADTAEEQRRQILAMIEALEAKNKQLRDDLGLRPGAPVPGGPGPKGPTPGARPKDPAPNERPKN